MWQVSFTSQVFLSGYKQLAISDHQNSPNIFNKFKYLSEIHFMDVIFVAIYNFSFIIICF